MPGVASGSQGAAGGCSADLSRHMGYAGRLTTGVSHLKKVFCTDLTSPRALYVSLLGSCAIAMRAA